MLVAPYASPAGMGGLKDALATSAQRGAWIRFVIGDLDDANGWNRRALEFLVEGQEGALIRERLRVLTPGPVIPVLFHAKVIAVDQDRGYLGSANLSWRGMEQNFEVGVSLTKTQAKSIDDLIAYWEARGLLLDRTSLLKS
jgi:phosphatidylserine/phosphatidylglycerophosphate/cardiolipin synthase-like enzyme